MRVPGLIVLLVLMAQAQEPPPAAPGKPAPAESPAPNQAQRTAINLLGQTDAGAGESRRNENVQFNLIDTATAKELMVRLGTSATIHSEFQSDRSYFGGEFGARPAATLHVPLSGGRGWHGALSFGHLNSFLSARTFFQPTSVKPARENEFGVNLAGPLWRGARVSIDLSTQAIRGNVNGNVIVPLLAERTPLAVEPRLRAIVQRYLDAYPLPDPRRPDQRAVNVNAEQRIDTYNAGGRLDQTLSTRDALRFRYQFTGQQVEAFQFVKGQNPDTSTRNHVSRITWTRAQSAATMIDTTLGFDRLGSLLQPDQEWPDANVGFNNAISSIGPSPIIPIDRAQNSFRTGFQFRQSRGNHQWSAGAEITRLQVNGLEQDGNRGIITFTNDFGRDFVTNLRLGTPSQHVRALGSTHRGYRQWLPVAFLHDRWKLNAATDLTLGLRFEPVPTPSEVNRLDRLPYRCDCNNLAPRAAGRFLRDWSWQGVVLVKNGTPFSIESGGDAPGVGNVDGQGGDRVHLVDPTVLGRTISHPDRSTELLPAQAFRFMQPTDARGNLGRNTFRRARIGNVNASLNRAFVLRGEARLLFRAESINFFNTPQFAEPTKELLAPTFGRITNTLNDGRTFRFTARFEF